MTDPSFKELLKRRKEANEIVKRQLMQRHNLSPRTPRRIHSQDTGNQNLNSQFLSQDYNPSRRREQLVHKGTNNRLPPLPKRQTGKQVKNENNFKVGQQKNLTNNKSVILIRKLGFPDDKSEQKIKQNISILSKRKSMSQESQQTKFISYKSIVLKESISQEKFALLPKALKSKTQSPANNKKNESSQLSLPLKESVILEEDDEIQFPQQEIQESPKRKMQQSISKIITNALIKRMSTEQLEKLNGGDTNASLDFIFNDEGLGLKPIQHRISLIHPEHSLITTHSRAHSKVNTPEKNSTEVQSPKSKIGSPRNFNVMDTPNKPSRFKILNQSPQKKNREYSDVPAFPELTDLAPLIKDNQGLGGGLTGILKLVKMESARSKSGISSIKKQKQDNKINLDKHKFIEDTPQKNPQQQTNIHVQNYAALKKEKLQQKQILKQIEQQKFITELEKEYNDYDVLKMFYSNKLEDIFVNQNDKPKEQKQLLRQVIDNILKKNINKQEIQQNIVKQTYEDNLPKNVWKLKIKKLKKDQNKNTKVIKKQYETQPESSNNISRRLDQTDQQIQTDDLTNETGNKQFITEEENNNNNSLVFWQTDNEKQNSKSRQDLIQQQQLIDFNISSQSGQIY